MSRSRSQNTSGTALSLQLARTLREGALWVFGALALILWYALFTYDLSDPGFSQASSGGSIQNGVGRFGAGVEVLWSFSDGRVGRLPPRGAFLVIGHSGWNGTS